ncbi:MAG: HK97 gp10 family phage protein [Clostridia bacterium]|nr:HK97 gp10 family phage protein [Clostridia bacterium]
MALLDFELPPELIRQLDKMADTEQWMPEVLNEVAPKFADKIKQNLSAHKDTGDLINSIAPQKPKKGKDGYSVSVYNPKAPSENGTRNALKLAELEFGNSNQAATPVVAPAREACAAEVEGIMKETFMKGMSG